jgi:hypothetical protein
MTTTHFARETLADRAEAQAGQAGGSRLATVGVTAVLIGCVVAVTYAAISGIGDWSQLVVLGGIALVTIGMMIAIDPLRKER